MDLESVELHEEQHAALGWVRFQSYAFARHMSWIPLAAEEVAMVATHLPMAFHAGEEGLRVCAMLGFSAGHNLLVAPDGRWLGRYVPARLRAYPFVLLGRDAATLAEGSQETARLGVHGEALLPIERPGVQPFFLHGQFAPLVQQTLDFLKTVWAGQERLQRMIPVLEKWELLVPWPEQNPAAEGGVGEAVPVAATRDTEWYRIDESRLDVLADAAWLELRHAGVMPLLYAHLFSQGHLATLRTLAQRQTPPQSTALRAQTPRGSGVGQEPPTPARASILPLPNRALSGMGSGTTTAVSAAEAESLQQFLDALAKGQD